MFKDQNKQQHFKADWLGICVLDPNHLLVKIAHTIDWDSFLKKFSQFYHPNMGRPTIPTRAKIGLLLVKHIYQYSDRELVQQLKENNYIQYLCDIHPTTAHTSISYSTISTFRKDIGIEGVKLIEQEILSLLKELKLLKGKKAKRLVVDTTVVPAAIKYPTDVNLLNTCREKILELLDKTRQFTKKRYRTYKRIAKKVFIRFQKLRRTAKNIRKKTQKQLIQFTRRNLRPLPEATQSLAQSVVKNKTVVNLIQKSHSIISTVSTILNQQQEIYKGKHVDNRIVSLWAPHIRPIVRGKYPVDVEFGPKALLSHVAGFLFLDHLSFHNVPDSKLLDMSLSAYKERFRSPPSQLAADRGFHAPENITLSQFHQVKNIAIQPKGKFTRYRQPLPFWKRLLRLRSVPLRLLYP